MNQKKTNTGKNIYRDRKGDNNILVQKIQTKIKAKIDASKYKRPTIIHEKQYT